uniref:Secreted protein n=1 Tax=Arundo donax TaxID=35708 RepID=A0A0A9FTJ7_ARUDO
MVEIMWVGARTFPLLIAVLRSSGMGGGVISGTGEIFPSSTSFSNVSLIAFSRASYEVGTTAPASLRA